MLFVRRLLLTLVVLPALDRLIFRAGLRQAQRDGGLPVSVTVEFERSGILYSTEHP